MTPMRLLNTWNSLVKSYSDTEEIAAFLKRNGIEVVDHSNSYRPTQDILSDIQTAWARGESEDNNDIWLHDWVKDMQTSNNQEGELYGMKPEDYIKSHTTVGGVLPAATDVKCFTTANYWAGCPTRRPPAIERVIFSDPATVVFWADGSKTVVKCQGGDLYDPEKGLMAAMLKKLYGNNNTYNKVMRPFLDQAVEEGYFL